MLVSLALMFTSLRYIVVLLKGLVIRRVEALFDQIIFRNAFRAMLLWARGDGSSCSRRASPPPWRFPWRAQAS